ncbi:FAD-dependent oxidoreductase [Phenylobacterium sp.]|jgi:3-phenylpropionate/trans-cinnamate dioxygenase ferredoxin reductase subunit|uniref:NAD(P)/FAD-dependent oxidoreductase n=1 Tax=Phenylobacterium sp. TaxID=1871053 RepID=UPI000C9873AB|nr:FAD-dependent oxidoreductase [Phenylobacterium sp.]MAK82555.1 ferredoxin reductase [Phenylobacterium sp.]|tara:strand:+ start:14118 stop:15347 length:1230 start_codon:yes stop_codon:yes gene_type:complete
MSDLSANVVILGAGHAGGTAAALLRQYGHAGPISLIGDEPLAPYQRPPLSKAWLKGEADADSLALKPLEFYAEHQIDFRPNIRAVKLRRSDKVVELSDGSTLHYDILILATGARAIKLPVPGADLAGLLELRTAADAEALKAAVGPGKRLAVVGGGYIGLEVAASGRALGAEVVVIERESRLLARVACEALSSFFQGVHETHGVHFEMGASVTGFVGENGHVTGVTLADGRTIACDAAVIGVGATPNDELAAESGLETARGVVVDLEARTSDPSIFAIGDVAHRPMPIYGRMFRMESVPNALEQAKQAASAITGRPAPAGEVPWQWSDQYDLKLQIAGYAFDTDEVLLRGDPASGKFAVFHLKGDQIQSVEAINSPPEFMMGKQLIGNRKSVSKAKLSDLSVSMKEVVA